MAGHTAQLHLQGTASLLPTQGENRGRFISGPDTAEAFRWSRGLLVPLAAPAPGPGTPSDATRVQRAASDAIRAQ